MAAMINLTDAHILIVDDSHLIRRIQRQTLTESGARVEEAENGQVALLKLRDSYTRNDPFALALVDLTMPVMDGVTLIREIRADNDLKKLPVIVVSNENEYDTILECARHGISGFVSKECGRERLLEIASESVQINEEHPRAPGLTAEEASRLLRVLEDTLQQEIGRGVYEAEAAEQTAPYQSVVEFLRMHCPEALP